MGVEKFAYLAAGPLMIGIGGWSAKEKWRKYSKGVDEVISDYDQLEPLARGISVSPVIEKEQLKSLINGLANAGNNSDVREMIQYDVTQLSDVHYLFVEGNTKHQIFARDVAKSITSKLPEAREEAIFDANLQLYKESGFGVALALLGAYMVGSTIRRYFSLNKGNNPATENNLSES